MFKKFATVFILIFFTSACANQALILSEPAGAQVFVDGQPIGLTPCKYEYANSAGTSFGVTVEKPGYEAIQYRLQADETDFKARRMWLTAGLMIPLGSPLVLGTFFTKKLKDSYNFVMKKAPLQRTAQIEPEEGTRF